MTEKMEQCPMCGAPATVHHADGDGDTSWIASPYTPEHVELIAALWKAADEMWWRYAGELSDDAPSEELRESVEALRPLFGEEQSR